MESEIIALNSLTIITHSKFEISRRTAVGVKYVRGLPGVRQHSRLSFLVQDHWGCVVVVESRKRGKAM